MPQDPAPPGAGENGEPAAPRPLPVFPLGTRIVLFYLAAVVLPRFAVGLGVGLALGPERLRDLAPPAGGEAVATPVFELLLAIQALTLPLVIAATGIFLRRVDGKSLAGIGVKPPRPLDLLAAPLAAGLLLAGWAGLASLGLDLRFARSAAAPAGGELVAVAVGLLATAALEEWIFRGYVYSTLRERLAWVHAAGVSALLFVLPHAASTEIDAVGMLNVFLIGLAFAAIREVRGNVWATTLFHATWNFLLGCVLSLPVSGLRFPGLHQTTVSGPAAWSGGDYGPEGSWALTGLLVPVLFLLAALLDRRRGGTTPGAGAGSDSAPGMRE